MKIKVIEVNQDGNIFYIGKIKASELVRIATTKVRSASTSADYKNYLTEIDESVREKINEGDIWYLKDLGSNPNIQRKESRQRLKEIGEYITKADSLFPNSIIINLTLKDDNSAGDVAEYIKIGDGFIEFQEEKIIASIIDGQHRLGGFKYTSDKESEREYYLNNYELIITIMIGLEIPQQAELFATINGKQTPVNKSILYDLSGVSESEYTELVTTHLIVKWFNVSEKSPLRDRIKMLGYGDGTISQSAFVDTLLPLIEDRKATMGSKILPVLREDYLLKDTNNIMGNLYNYFKCFKELFPNEWEYKLNREDDVKYILNKSTGIGGIMIAYSYVYLYMWDKGDFTYKCLFNLLHKLKEANFQFSSNIYPGGSKAIQNKLAMDIVEVLFTDEEITTYRDKYISYYNENISDFYNFMKKYIDYKVSSLNIYKEFLLKDIVNEYWNSEQLSDSERQSLGKYFYDGVKSGKYENVKSISKNFNGHARYSHM